MTEDRVAEPNEKLQKLYTFAFHTHKKNKSYPHTLSGASLYIFFSQMHIRENSEGISMTTFPGKLLLNKTIYSSLLAALHLNVGSTTRACASQRTGRQQRQTLSVDGALSGARRF